MKSLFVSDLHGNIKKYDRLLQLIETEKPQLFFFGGDLDGQVNSATGSSIHFYNDYLIPKFDKLRNNLGNNYPQVFIILGNDDPKIDEEFLFEGENKNLWFYVHGKKVELNKFTVHGYAYSPPSPFQLKDWEKYDVSRYIDPGCISPEEGYRTKSLENNHIKYITIAKDLKEQFEDRNLTNSIILFHTPPYNTKLDRAGLDKKVIDHAPVDVHVGSIAVRKFIEIRQPYLTLHGHIHESTKLTGQWYDSIGKTTCFNAAHNGHELSVIKFDLNDLSTAERLLI